MNRNLKFHQGIGILIVAVLLSVAWVEFLVSPCCFPHLR